MNRIIYIFFIIIIGACTPYYKTTEVNFSDLDSNIIQQQNNSIFENKRVHFTGNINFKNKKYKIKGNLVIENNDRFQLQLISKTLGIEVFKAQFLKDSLIFIDKLSKQYYYGKTTEFKFLIGSNFYSGQILKLFFGRIVFPIKNYNCSNFYNTCTFEFNNFSGDVVFNNRAYLSRHTIISNDNYLTINFDNYLKKNNIPENIIFNIKKRNDIITISLNIIKVKSQNVNLKKLIIPNKFVQINVH